MRESLNLRYGSLWVVCLAWCARRVTWFVSVLFAALSRRWLPSAVVRSRGWSWPVRKRRRRQRPARGCCSQRGCCSASTTRRELVAPPHSAGCYTTVTSDHITLPFFVGDLRLLMEACSQLRRAATQAGTQNNKREGREGGRARGSGHRARVSAARTR